MGTARAKEIKMVCGNCKFFHPQTSTCRIGPPVHQADGTESAPVENYPPGNPAFLGTWPTVKPDDPDFFCYAGTFIHERYVHFRDGQ